MCLAIYDAVKLLYHFTFPPVMRESSISSRPCQHFVLSDFLILVFAGLCDIPFHGSFNFPDN